MKTGILPLLCTDLSMLIADRYARRNGRWLADAWGVHFSLAQLLDERRINLCSHGELVPTLINLIRQFLSSRRRTIQW